MLETLFQEWQPHETSGVRPLHHNCPHCVHERRANEWQAEPGISEFPMDFHITRLNLHCNPSSRRVTLVSVQPHVLKSKSHKTDTDTEKKSDVNICQQHVKLWLSPPLTNCNPQFTEAVIMTPPRPPCLSLSFAHFLFFSPQAYEFPFPCSFCSCSFY